MSPEELDADDLLIDETRAVIEDSKGAVKDYQDRLVVAVEEGTVSEVRGTRSTRG